MSFQHKKERKRSSLKNNTDIAKEHLFIATGPMLCRKKKKMPLAGLVEDRHLSDAFGEMMDLH